MGTTEVCSPMPATVNLLEPNGMPIVLRLVCADVVRCRHQASPLEPRSIPFGGEILLVAFCYSARCAGASLSEWLQRQGCGDALELLVTAGFSCVAQLRELKTPQDYSICFRGKLVGMPACILRGLIVYRSAPTEAISFYQCSGSKRPQQQQYCRRATFW
jgi:hypothetical protein